MSNVRYDYDLLEREYITTDVSLRELARRHGIGTHSLVMIQSKKRDWVRKRAEYRAMASDKSVIYMADAEGMRRAREARVRDNAIDMIDEAISKLRDDMKRTRKVLAADGGVEEEPAMVIRPAEIAQLLDRLQTFFGRPSSITEERSFGLSLEGGVSSDVLREFVEATRGLEATGGGASESPIPRTRPTGEGGGS